MSVQSRIRALEVAANSGNSSNSSSAAVSSRPSPHPISSPRTSLTFSSDDALTSVSSSPTAVSLLDDMDSFVIMAGGPIGSSPSSPPAMPSPMQNGSLAVGKPMIPPKSPGLQSAKSLSTSPRPLINFSSPPRLKESVHGLGLSAVIPALPPRKQPSIQSLNLTLGGTPPLPPRSQRIPSPPPTPGIFKRSDSLTIDQIPKLNNSNGSSSSSKTRHNHASSTSSFISLSLSSDPGDADRINDDTVTISSPATSLSDDHSSTHKSVSIHDWNQKTPTLSQRPFKSPAPYISKNIVPSPPPRGRASPAPSLTGSFQSQSTTQTQRRPAPPPPSSRPSHLTSSSSAHSSFSSSASSSASTSAVPSTRRKTPVPPTARLRYEALFERNKASSSASSSSDNVASPSSSRSRGRATGWRGVSIDFMTAGPSVPPGMENRLSGTIVKSIWSCSKLDKPFLREVWSDCDRDKSGYLDRESFIQGMWRIDEELSKRASAKRPLPRQAPIVPQRLPYNPRR